MRRKILETAVELGYTNKRVISREKKLCILIENMDYNTPNQFGHDIILGFRQMAEPDGWIVDVVPIDKDFQRSIPYGVFMIQNDYQGAFILGFSLIDPGWQNLSQVKFRRFSTTTILAAIPGLPPLAATVRRASITQSNTLSVWGIKK